ncbi:alpha-L-arabinofuranosidase C-terminal domain-containing protein [Pullulanibacillus sp. KACC 23026]|uniref:alpha-L-arabinofuranosidase C-terminal domain-containing protein n=1 Tax=Pullulanibacillus sp. KACC 23026 TaxID=3028315 RepID=UPI0023AFF409|nr:alpha-L-arabinofuranosidase C-terminal domain-containing protein [Pullulanibacillus sp. KACC 23026]WEG10957.1 alpha-L-arabinofuranosidase C-terminal domain-containing protein [Pullulanibacillus sp. KACC 23026]
MTKSASVQINGDQIGKERIHPFIFGHFVEDIRDHMDAMLAYGLQDMDFEHEDLKIKGVSGSWLPFTNGRHTQFALEPAAPKHSGHSQKIRIFSDDDGYGGIAQKLSVRGSVTYHFQLFARASIEINEVKLEMIDKHTQEKLMQTTIPIDSHDWKEYKGQFSLERDCCEAELRIFISSEDKGWKDSVATGMLWIDHFSMLPEDSVGIVKKQVFDMSQDLNAGIMRLGGNYISAYHWEHGVGSVYERPVMLNEAWDTLACKYFGTDEFLAFCEELGVAPQICVNDGSGSPEEAARWVEYCNGEETTPMGALRAQNGHKSPYGVKYWEIGNEVWGNWQVGHCTAEAFANRCVRFAKAMKAADPNIVLLACGHTDPEWNKTVLQMAGNYIDYLTLHIYQGYGHFGYINKEVSQADKYRAIVSYPEVTHRFLNEIRETLKDYPHVKLAVTEYNTMYYPNNIRKGLPNEHTLEAAIANAGNLNEFIRNCDLIEIGNFSDLVNGWLGGCIRVGDHYADQFRGKEPGWSGKPDVVYGTPTYHVLKLYANRDIAYLVETQVECDSFCFSNQHNRVQTDKLPELDVVSCINESRDVMTVFIVNRSLEDVTVDLYPNAFHFNGRMKVGEITGPDINCINDVFNPEAITCHYETFEIDGAPINYLLKAHSIYTFELMG